VFLDPPYYNKGANLYLNAFDHPKHQALAAFLQVRRRFCWVMTYDNVKQIRELYASCEQVPFDLSYSAFERRSGQELLIHPLQVIVPRAARRALRQAA
jgi:DNA adenine methylase